MRPLTRQDASFLYADTGHANANVTFVQIYDQRAAHGGKVRFKSIMAHIESRLHRSPIQLATSEVRCSGGVDAHENQE